jgi:hypothetical protein
MIQDILIFYAAYLVFSFLIGLLFDRPKKSVLTSVRPRQDDWMDDFSALVFRCLGRTECRAVAVDHRSGLGL